MNTYIALLRGINVSGQKKMQMAELREGFEGLGFGEVETYVQSGNVAFESEEGDGDELARQIEAEIEARFGYGVTVFVRRPEDFERILKGNPFLKRREVDIDRLYVTFLERAPGEEEAGRLAAPEGIADEFILGEREIFLYCPGGYGTTKLSNNFFERKLGMAATTRNWKTVNALWEMGRRR